MTSAELSSLFSGVRWAGDEKVAVDPDEVYYAATQAQKEILARTTYLEGKGQLAFIANQDTYTFPVQTITGVAVVAGTVQVTMTAHPYNTNDEAYFWGILGSVEANGRFKLTKVTANIVSLNGLTTCTTYVSGGQSVHILAGAKKFLDSGIRLLSDTSGNLTWTLEKKTKAWVELQRNLFGVNAQPAAPTPNNQSVICFYEEYTDPITLGLLGTPQTAIIAEPIFYRKHVDGYDDISATVNPILPSMFDMVLKTGTYFHLFKFRPEKGATAEAGKWMQEFEIELKKMNKVHGQQKQAMPSAEIGLIW